MPSTSNNSKTSYLATLAALLGQSSDLQTSYIIISYTVIITAIKEYTEQK